MKGESGGREGKGKVERKKTGKTKERNLRYRRKKQEAKRGNKRKEEWL